ncbi:hypothetical protein B484DRAFT_456942 [Ochromonadaceae sp. CCMP2298]|nr:hypothetical protein B484DRAFT_456942 [Ochromonadaceae sp. CCMP2298]
MDDASAEGSMSPRDRGAETEGNGAGAELSAVQIPLSQYTLPQIKEFLSERGLSRRGVRAVLVSRLGVALRDARGETGKRRKRKRDAHSTDEAEEEITVRGCTAARTTATSAAAAAAAADVAAAAAAVCPTAALTARREAFKSSAGEVVSRLRQGLDLLSLLSPPNPHLPLPETLCPFEASSLSQQLTRALYSNTELFSRLHKCASLPNTLPNALPTLSALNAATPQLSALAHSLGLDRIPPKRQKQTAQKCVMGYVKLGPGPVGELRKLVKGALAALHAAGSVTVDARLTRMKECNLSAEELGEMMVALEGALGGVLELSRVLGEWTKPEKPPKASSPLVLSVVLPLFKYNIKELRGFLRERGLRLAGEKDELVSRLQAALERGGEHSSTSSSSSSSSAPTPAPAPSPSSKVGAEVARSGAGRKRNRNPHFRDGAEEEDK